MHLRLPGVLVPLLLIASLGCGGGGGPRTGRGGRPVGQIRQPPPPKEAPPAPPRQNVPLDPALSAAARRKVVEAMQSSDPLVRAQAIEALRASPDAESNRQVVRALADPHPGVRFAAAMLVGELGIRDGYPSLRRLAGDPDANVQVAARFALHKLGDARLTHDLEKLAQSEDPRVRRNVALALGLLGEKSAIRTILRVLRSDADPLVRQQAIEAMWRLGDDEALKSIVALTASGYADDKIVGLLALAAPRRQIVREHVRGLLAGDDVHVEVTLVAARAMGMLGSDEGYKIALDAARSRDPQQRFLAALALGAIGRPDAQDDLRRLLADPEPNVQLAAASAALQLAKG